jgi:hypothetical protein
MGDEFSRTNAPDNQTVNLSERWERSYWARRFGVTDEELREAVALVGPLAEDVRKYFTARNIH